MTGMDLSTAVSHGLAPIVLVLDNHGYGAERAIVDGPFNDIAPWDYVVAAEAVGAEGRRVATPPELDDALAEARRGTGRAWLLWIDLDPTTRHGRCARWARGSSSSCTRPTEGRRAPSPRRPPAAGAPRWSA